MSTAPPVREALLAQLQRHEGLRLKPYRCTAGKLTIGIGRNLDDVGISAEEAGVLLANDVAKVVRALSAHDWFQALDPVRQDVLINMAFNLGYGGLMKFKRTLNLIQSENYSDAAQAMLGSLWAKQVGGRAKELATQMRTGARSR